MAEESTFQSIFGQTPGQLGVGAAGTFAGGALNYYFNSRLQDRQFAEQEKLQQSAAKLNAQAVRSQAQLQAQGMANAGLNPASVTGAGAPSVQAGSAAGANTQLASIFSGVAEIVAAAKSPSEVENVQADTGLKGAQKSETEQRVSDLVPAQIDEIRQRIDKLFEDTTAAKNLNDAWSAKDNFVKSYAPSMFEQMRSKLQKEGTWNNLGEKTRETISGLADGEVEVGLGGLEGLQDLIKSQLDLSDADARTASNAFNLVILDKQLKSPEVMEAIASLPKTQQDEMNANIRKMNQEILGIIQQIEESKTQADLNKANKAITDFKREVEELDSPNWLWSKGRKGDAVKSVFFKAAQHAADMQKAAASGIAAGAGAGVAGGLVGGKAVGRAVDKAAGKAAGKAVKSEMNKPSISIQRYLDHSNPYGNGDYWNTYFMDKNKK